jgi:anti-sigma regulatory factor (Ser/Thr protein kinase)
VLPEGFRHEAFLYADGREFVDGVAAFVEGGLDAAEPVLVVLPADKIRILRERLDGRADEVAFADMAQVGRNPGRILHAWYEFAGRHVAPGQAARGVGEPVFPERSPDELAECQRHEQLLNLAFDGGPAWSLMCPYDTRALTREAVDEARHSHPLLRLDGDLYGNARYRPLDPTEPFSAPLGPAPPSASVWPVTRDTLTDVRGAVRRRAVAAGLDRQGADDLVMAVSELAANTVRHGGGRGVLRSWQAREALVHEVEDRGVIVDPLVGRSLPPADEIGGRGLWLVNQLCDLVQMRWDAGGTVVRVHMHVR